MALTVQSAAEILCSLSMVFGNADVTRSPRATAALPVDRVEVYGPSR